MGIIIMAPSPAARPPIGAPIRLTRSIIIAGTQPLLLAIHSGNVVAQFPSVVRVAVSRCVASAPNLWCTCGVRTPS